MYNNNDNNKYSFYNSNSLKTLGKKSLQSFLGNRFFKIGYSGWGIKCFSWGKKNIK